jgi:hypothetical protein
MKAALSAHFWTAALLAAATLASSGSAARPAPARPACCDCPKEKTGVVLAAAKAGKQKPPFCPVCKDHRLSLKYTKKLPQRFEWGGKVYFCCAHCDMSGYK